MNRKKLGIVLVMLSVLLLPVVSMAADGILDFLDFAETYTDAGFGYDVDDRLVVKNIGSSSIDIESPVIKNGSSAVNAYLFNVSENSRANTNPVAFWCFNDLNVNSNKFIVELDTSSLNKNKTYYVYATPVDVFMGDWNNGPCSTSEAKEFLGRGLLGNDSTVNGEDPCFNINSNVYGVGTYCEDHVSGNSSSTNMSDIYSINNISFICNNNGTVTAKRQSYADVDIEVLMWEDDREQFRRIGTVNSERKEYTFTPQERNHFSIRFEPVDGSKKINEDGHCLTTQDPEVKPVNPDSPVKPPVVGPKENIMLIIFGTIVLYVVYRIARRKA